MKLYLAVNKDGTEIVSNKSMFRAEIGLQSLIDKFDTKYEMYRYKCINVWADDYSTGHYNVPIFTGTILPEGSVEKITGKKITWNDKPIEIELNKITICQTKKF